MLNSITKDIKTVFGKNLVSMRFFGSYASGKQKNISDIDIFVVADNLPLGFLAGEDSYRAIVIVFRRGAPYK